MADTAVAESPKCQRPGFFTLIHMATKLSVIQLVLRLGDWIKAVAVRKHRPDLVRTYQVRPKLPVQVFIPSSLSQTPSSPLPTLFTIHGGGFCIGTPNDDNEWNRHFADTQSILVIALNYAKAPANAFPGPLNDVEALLHAALADESLPIDKSRLAVAGFSAGGELALTVSRREAHKARDGKVFADFKAAIPMYPVLDHATPPTKVKAARRRYKLGRLTGFRGKKKDLVIPFADMFDWGYNPYGQDLSDPDMSAFYGERADFPPHLFVIGAELDFLAWEAGAFARRMAGREVTQDVPGREEPGEKHELELADERFHWEARAASSDSSVRWLLVPDVTHSFDWKPAGNMVFDKAAREDANAKTIQTIKLIGTWLNHTAWAPRKGDDEETALA